jgi:hypothetical protein
MITGIPCVPGQQGVHHAFVVGRQVLNHHKRRTRIAGAGGKEAFKRIQPAGGRANAHYMILKLGTFSGGSRRW